MPAIPAIGLALGASAGTAAAVGTMAVVGTAGAAAAVYGANKNAKTAKQVNAANIQATKDADQLAYRRWLETQGVGQDGAPINTWLPRYATVSKPFGETRKFRSIRSPEPGGGLSTPRFDTGNTTPATTFGGGGGGFSRFAGSYNQPVAAL